MVKVLKRPESTSIIIERTYHLIKNQIELVNIFESVDPNNVIFEERIIDDQMFQPQQAVLIRERINELISLTRYIVPYELICETTPKIKQLFQRK